jgi:hypothetical protein
MAEGTQIWIDALRSGTYKQSHLELGNVESGFCCLGLACHLAFEHGVIGIPHNPGYGTLSENPEVVKWVGLATRNGAYGNADSLILDNDDYRLTFDQIADIIEYNPPGLLV